MNSNLYQQEIDGRTEEVEWRERNCGDEDGKNIFVNLIAENDEF